MMAGSFITSREKLLEHAYFTEESKEEKLRIKHDNNLKFMDCITMNLYYGAYEREEDKIKACHAALTLWKTLIYDENYLFYHCRMSTIYELLAKSYARLKKREETIDALKNALHHAKCYDNLPAGEQHYTSLFVKATSTDASRTAKNYTETDTYLVKQYMQHKVFDFLRGDDAFLQLEKQM